MRYAITWCLLAATFVFGFGRLNWASFHRLTVQGVSGQATVIELLPKIHNTLRYEYHIAGHTFHGQMQSWPPNPPLEQLAVGQSVVIVYDPEHPENSALGDPHPMLENETISIAFIAIVFPTAIVIRWALIASRNRKAAQV